MKFALIIVSFGIATGNSIITGSEIAVVSIETERLCRAAETIINTAFKDGYAPMVAACIQVKE